MEIKSEIRFIPDIFYKPFNKVTFLLLLALLSIPLKAQLNTNYFINVGKNEIVASNYFEAINKFNIVIKLKPFLPEPYYYRGMAKYYLGDFRGAKQDFSKTIKIKINYVDAYIFRAITEFHLKKKSAYVVYRLRIQ